MLKMSVTSKIASLAAISSLALASLSATSVLAAGTKTTKEVRSQQQVAKSLESDWKTDASNLNKDIAQTGHIMFLENTWLKTHTTKDQKDLAGKLVNQYLKEVQRAEAVIAQHHGFNSSGLVAANSSNPASRSVKTLNNDLSQLHKTAEQLDALLK